MSYYYAIKLRLVDSHLSWLWYVKSRPPFLHLIRTSGLTFSGLWSFQNVVATFVFQQCTTKSVLKGLHNIKTWMDWLKRNGLSTENIHINNWRGTTKVDELKRNNWRGTTEQEHLKRNVWRGTIEEEQLKSNCWRGMAEVWRTVTETLKRDNWRGKAEEERRKVIVNWYYD